MAEEGVLDNDADSMSEEDEEEEVVNASEEKEQKKVDVISNLARLDTSVCVCIEYENMHIRWVDWTPTFDKYEQQKTIVQLHRLDSSTS